MTREKEIQSQSINDKLKHISQKTGVAYRYVSINFFLERMVARILTSSLKEDLTFKGGYVGLRVYNTQRYTVDLDAVLDSTSNIENLQVLRNTIEIDLHDGVWFELEREKKLPLQTYKGGVKQVYRTGLDEKPKGIKRSTVVHFDIGFEDSIVPDAIFTKTPLMLSEGSLSWKVYPVETIIAEKLHAFIFRDGASSRAKDMYDLSFYLPQADVKTLKSAIESCFKKRKTVLLSHFYETMKSYDYEYARYAWKKVFAAPEKEVSFDSCLDTVLEKLKRINI